MHLFIGLRKALEGIQVILMAAHYDESSKNAKTRSYKRKLHTGTFKTARYKEEKCPKGRSPICASYTLRG
jgi:hypothetical protein